MIVKEKGILYDIDWCESKAREMKDLVDKDAARYRREVLGEWESGEYTETKKENTILQTAEKLQELLIEENRDALCERCNDVHFEGHAGGGSMHTGCEGSRCERGEDDFIGEFESEYDFKLTRFPLFPMKIPTSPNAKEMVSIDGGQTSKFVNDYEKLVNLYKYFVRLYEHENDITDALVEYLEEYGKEVSAEVLFPTCRPYYPKLKNKDDIKILPMQEPMPESWQRLKNNFVSCIGKQKENKMIKAIRETLESYKLAVLVPGSTESNTKVTIDTKSNSVYLKVDYSKVTSFIGESVDLETENAFLIPEKFEVERLEYNIDAGIVEISIPVDSRIKIVKPKAKRKPKVAKKESVVTETGDVKE